MRFNCDKGSFDFHRVDRSTRFVAVHNVVWTATNAPDAFAMSTAPGGLVQAFLERHLAGDIGFDRSSVVNKQQWMTDLMRNAIATHFPGQHEQTRRHSLTVIHLRTSAMSDAVCRGQRCPPRDEGHGFRTIHRWLSKSRGRTRATPRTWCVACRRCSLPRGRRLHADHKVSDKLLAELRDNRFLMPMLHIAESTMAIRPRSVRFGIERPISSVRRLLVRATSCPGRGSNS